MSYFARSGKKKPEPSEGDRPSIGAVLDHYGVDWWDGPGNIMVRCPLHSDDHPSCSVKVSEDLWCCHSCGESGDSWSLLMKKEGLDFVEAKKFAVAKGLWTDPGRLGGREVQGAQGGLDSRSRGRTGSKGYVPSWRRK